MPSAFSIFGELRADVGNFQKNLLAAETRLKATKEAIDQTEAKAKSLGQTSAVVGRQYEKLNQSVDQHTNKLNQAAKAYERGDISAKQMGSTLGSVDKATTGLNSRLADANARLTDFAAKQANVMSRLKELGSSMSQVGQSLTMGITLPLAAIGTAVLKAGAGYEEALNIFQAVTHATAAQMERAAKVAKDLGADLTLPATSAKDAALAMNELGKAGLTANEAMDAAKGVLQLAAAGALDEAKAAETAANSLNAFGLAAKESTRIADLLAAAANASSAEVSDIALSMQQASSSFAAAKIPIEDMVTAISALANSGIKGSDAGTSLKQFMIRLQAPTAEAAQAMQQLGVSVFDTTGRMRQMPEIIGQFATALAGLTDEQKAQALNNIFGSDAIRAAQILFKMGTEGFSKLKEAVTANGAAAELANARMKGLSGAWKGFVSQLETVGISIYEVIKAPLTEFLQSLAKYIGDAGTAFNQLTPFVQQGIIAFAAIAAAAGPVLIVVGALATAITSIVSIIGLLGGATGLGIIAAVIAGIGLAIAPVIAWAAVLYKAWQADFGGIRTTTLEVAQMVEAAWNTLMTGLGSLTSRILTGIAVFWQDHGTEVMRIVRGAGKIVADYYQMMFTALKGIIKLGLQIIQGDWDGAWLTFLMTVKDVAAKAAKLATDIIYQVSLAFETMWPYLAKWGTQFITTLSRWAYEAATAFGKIILNLPLILIAIIPKMIKAGMQISFAILEGIKQGFLQGSGSIDSNLGASVDDGSGSWLAKLLGNQGGITPKLGGEGISPLAKTLDGLKDKVDGVGKAAKGTTAALNEMKSVDVTQLLNAMRGAVGGKESEGYGPDVINKDSGATGRFQVMESNIAAWTKATFGVAMSPEAFRKDTAAQIAVFNKIMGGYLTKALQETGGEWQKAIRIAAASWYGNPAVASSTYNDTTPQYSNGHKYPSKNAYGLDVLARVKASLGGSVSSSADMGSIFTEQTQQLEDGIKQLSTAWDDYVTALKPAKTEQEKLNEILTDPNVIKALEARDKVTRDYIVSFMKLGALYKDFQNIEPFTGSDPAGLGREPGSIFTGMGLNVMHGAGDGVENNNPDGPLPPPPKNIWDNFWSMMQTKLNAFKNSLPSVKQAIGESLVNGISRIGDVFSNALSSWDGTAKGFFKSLASGFKQLVSQILQELVRIMVMKAVFAIIGMFAGGAGAGAGGGVGAGAIGGAGAGVGAAEGGFVNGPGTSTSDSILARLSNGEFVMKASAVSKFGPAFFEKLNNGFATPAPAFAGGGMVGAVSNSSSVTNSPIFNINVMGGGGSNSMQTAKQIQREVAKLMRGEEIRNK